MKKISSLIKRLSPLLLTLVLFFTFATPTQVLAQEQTYPGTYNGKVTKVIDGNSFQIETLDGQEIAIKIAGIDTTPNKDALKLTNALLLGKNIKVEVLSNTYYNKKPYSYAIVYYNNQDVASMYLQSGYCKVDSSKISSTLAQTYNSYQNTAKYYKEGIWK